MTSARRFWGSLLGNLALFLIEEGVTGFIYTYRYFRGPKPKDAELPVSLRRETNQPRTCGCVGRGSVERTSPRPRLCSLPSIHAGQRVSWRWDGVLRGVRSCHRHCYPARHWHVHRPAAVRVHPHVLLSLAWALVLVLVCAYNEHSVHMRLYAVINPTPSPHMCVRGMGAWALYQVSRRHDGSEP